jgi:hypothetical protein
MMTCILYYSIVHFSSNAGGINDEPKEHVNENSERKTNEEWLIKIIFL